MNPTDETEIIPLTLADDAPAPAPAPAQPAAPVVTGSKGSFYQTDWQSFFAVPPLPQPDKK